MIKNKHLRNLLILLLALAATVYASTCLVERFGVSARKTSADGTSSYLRSLQHKLYEKLLDKNHAESEILIRRILKLDPKNTAMKRIAGKIYYHNGKLNEAENMLRNQLMRNPGDILCRNNYAMVLLARKRPEALRELVKAFAASGQSPFIAENIMYAAKKLNMPQISLPEKTALQPLFTAVPVDAISSPEEKKL